jgi:hypothetical protein
MLKPNLFDEAARVLAMPIPRRKAFKYVATGFAGALLSLLWPNRARANDYVPQCGNTCKGCITDAACYGKLAHSSCTVGGKIGYCNTTTKCFVYSVSQACCTCTAGSALAAPDINTIPDVAITRETSLAAGNCQEGTDLVASWFPGRHSVSAREAAAAAIAREKPWLAREIARTAHVIHRSAQV